MKNLLKKVAIAAAMAGAVSAVTAAPVVGTANLTFGLVTISAGAGGTPTNIDWNNGGGVNINPPPNAVATYGSFSTVDVGNTGSFAAAPFAGVTTGLIQDMTDDPADANFVPLGASVTPNFLIFAAQPNWQFTLTNLVPVLGVSPFLLAQVGSSVSATISASGTVCDAGATGAANVCDLTDDVTPWTGIWSAQYTNTTIAALTALLAGGGSLANNTWSATIEATAVPEPGTIALLGLGLLGLAASRRRTTK